MSVSLKMFTKNLPYVVRSEAQI